MIETITEAAFHLSRWTELGILSKATLLLVSGLTMWHLARHCPASVRHLLLTSTFSALLALPLIVITAPEVSFHIPVSGTRAPTFSDLRYPTSSVAVSQQPNAGSTNRQRESRSTMLPSWERVLRSVWMTGSVLMLLFLVLNVWRLHRLSRNGIPAPELGAGLETLAAECGIRRPVELLLHEEIAAPLTCGFSRPAILLPKDARFWAEDDLRRALVHELEHVRRADWGVQLVARATCALYWFHPLVWMASRKLSLEAERACDDAVVQREESTAYAEQLVSLARRLSNASVQPALGMVHRSDLSTRVTAVLDASQSRGRAGVLTVAIVLSIAILIVLAIGPVRAVAQLAQAADPRLPASQKQTYRATPLDEALFQAAERGDTSGVERLLSSGANVNAKLSGDGSPLIAAARNGHDKTVTLLLDRGADCNMAVPGDGSPLIMAAENGHLSTARLLLDRGADIHMPVPGDGNPLIMAARGGSVEVVEFLLNRGANIEQVVPGDENALIEASASGHLGVVKLLVNRGANVNSRVWVELSGDRASEWRTPVTMARRNGYTAVVDYLRSVGARE
jgi:beta-lactamase regulating signal transducer with metallopeptidase domain